MKLEDKIQIPVKCPGCGAETKVSIAKLRKEKIVTCKGCGAKIETEGNAEEAAKKLGDFEKGLEKALKGLGKRR